MKQKASTAASSFPLSLALQVSALFVGTAIAVTALSSQAFAHGNKPHVAPTAAASISAEEHAFGRQGDPKKAARTIAIDMRDGMRFSPANISVKQGETIRFVVRNKGKLLHEMVIGTLQDLQAHGELMKQHPGMEHDEPYMAHVDPGQQQELVWQFTQAGEFYFGCLIPGHFDAGMIGKIAVNKA